MRQSKYAEIEPLFSDVLTPAVMSQPQGAGLLRTRGDVRARNGQWKEAATDFSRVIELQPTNHLAYHALAPLLVQSGDLEGYRQHCTRALAQFGGTGDPVIAERMAKDCLILPSPKADLKAIGELAETAVTAGKGHSSLLDFQFAKGLAEYRQGHFGEAVDWMGKVLGSSAGDPFLEAEANVVLGMAQYQRQQPDQARASLAKAVEFQEKKLPKLASGDIGADWIDWIVVHALVKEASELIKKP